MCTLFNLVYQVNLRVILPAFLFLSLTLHSDLSSVVKGGGTVNVKKGDCPVGLNDIL